MGRLPAGCLRPTLGRQPATAQAEPPATVFAAELAEARKPALVRLVEALRRR